MKHTGVEAAEFFWLLHAICVLHRKPFSMELAQQQLAAPHTLITLERAADAYGFDASLREISAECIHGEAFPLVAWTCSTPDGTPDISQESLVETARECASRARVAPVLILQCDGTHVLVISPGSAVPDTIPVAEFTQRYCGYVTRISPREEPPSDPDAKAHMRAARGFGFAWFIPELMKHKRLWREVLLASLAIQLIALATPLFTQAIIDKVIVHRTESTLIVLVIGMAIFAFFSAGLTWLRQYIMLHTGNRVDAALSAAVFDRLLKLPPAFFQHRATGVIAARMHGVETIREFIASAAVTLILDCPFLLIFVAIMFYYSVKLTLIVLAIMALIGFLSAAVAPLFQTRLQEQFQLGARNQAFLTEYIVGMETVKSLQFEPQLSCRYAGYLASYLRSGFATRQLANTYNTVSGLLEQMMNLIVLAVGAYTVMHSMEFTIGMLVAFQMFSSRLSQPMLRLVGLWQQFQQASLSVARLGDLMNAPTEAYSMFPARDSARKGEICLHDVAFRYSDHLPMVYEDLSLNVRAGQCVGIMGPSGCGKSTLAKLLLGFCQATAGRITIDGIDVRHLSANELRSHFGVVPQETVLFSGTIYDNLQMADPNANFEQIVAACKMAEIHSTIVALPEGYQTAIGERGSGLSGGQKQRIAIARALLKRPTILVFDEATSALDGPTAEQFARTINSLKGKVTILFITHGLPKGLQVDAAYRLTAVGAHLVMARHDTHNASTSGTVAPCPVARPETME